MSLSSSDRESDTSGVEPFQTTHWSVVLQAGRHDSPQAREALDKLCVTYRPPLYTYIRHKGHTHEEAEDLIQDFLRRLLQNDYLAHADRHKGKFRSFLLAALNHFLSNERRHAQAAKRGGGQPVISLDDTTAEARYASELVSNLTPEKAYERRWALTLLGRALARLREEFAAADKARLFEQLEGFLTTEAAESDYNTVAAQLDMTTGAVAVAVHRLRHRCRELVREEIAPTVGGPAEVEEEIHWLFAALA